MGESNEDSVNGKCVEPPSKKVKIDCVVVREEPVKDFAAGKEDGPSSTRNEEQPKEVPELNSKVGDDTSDESQSKKGERVCSICKVSKMQVDNFSQNQRRKGSFAKCNVCIGSEKEEKNALAKAQKQAKEER